MRKSLGALAAAIALFVVMQDAEAQTILGQPIYLRGDVGASFATGADIHDNLFDAVNGQICGDPTCTLAGRLNHIGSSPLFGAGVGAQVMPDFRADVTYTYRGGFHLEEDDKGAAVGRFTANIHSHAVMLNGYWDVPTAFADLGPLRPFLGAGIGWARNSMFDFHQAFLGAIFGNPRGSTDNFAWQAGAGLAYAATSELTVDVGYRYFDAGRIETDAGTTTNTLGAPFPYVGSHGELSAHEILVSLRFAL